MGTLDRMVGEPHPVKRGRGRVGVWEGACRAARTAQAAVAGVSRGCRMEPARQGL